MGYINTQSEYQKASNAPPKLSEAVLFWCSDLFFFPYLFVLSRTILMKLDIGF